ncbi:MAG: hypothetical protein C4311_15260 [Chloroflexota bacterium]
MGHLAHQVGECYTQAGVQPLVVQDQAGIADSGLRQRSHVALACRRIGQHSSQHVPGRAWAIVAHDRQQVRLARPGDVFHLTLQRTIRRQPQARRIDLIQRGLRAPGEGLIGAGLGSGDCAGRAHLHNGQVSGHLLHVGHDHASGRVHMAGQPAPGRPVPGV